VPAPLPLLLDDLFARVLESRESVGGFRTPEIQGGMINPASSLLMPAKREALLQMEQPVIATALGHGGTLDTAMIRWVETALADALDDQLACEHVR
jgi:hypothetical protein